MKDEENCLFTINSLEENMIIFFPQYLAKIGNTKKFNFESNNEENGETEEFENKVTIAKRWWLFGDKFS